MAYTARTDTRSYPAVQSQPPQTQNSSTSKNALPNCVEIDSLVLSIDVCALTNEEIPTMNPLPHMEKCAYLPHISTVPNLNPGHLLFLLALYMQIIPSAPLTPHMDSSAHKLELSSANGTWNADRSDQLKPELVLMCGANRSQDSSELCRTALTGINWNALLRSTIVHIQLIL